MDFFPAEADFLEKRQGAKTQLVWAKISSDLFTPVSATLKLEKQYKNCFLLESVYGGETRGRYSVIGLGNLAEWEAQGQEAFFNGEKQSEPALISLKNLIRDTDIEVDPELPPMAFGLFGYVGYDCIRLFEDIPNSNQDELGIPDSKLFTPQMVLIFDSVKDCLYIIRAVLAEDQTSYIDICSEISALVENLKKPDEGSEEFTNNSEIEFSSNCTREEYHGVVEKAKEYIRAGDIFQVVPSQRFSASFELPPFAFYRSLRNLNPSPFLFYLKLDDFCVIGSSPEILVRLRDGKVTIRPIAGTRKRGANQAEDEELKQDLLSDQKELAEHLMLLDLGRNDVGRVAEGGKVEVTEQMIVEYYSHVMHIVSNVEGDIASDKDAVDALAAGFPAGTVSGAPKIRAMEIIDELEKVKRKFYGGAVGYFAGNQMDTCIALRTALIKNGKIYLQAGGGVVADSDPEAEYQETINKAKALMKAAEGAKDYI